MLPVIPSVITVYLVTVSMVFFSFFTAKIARMKLRRSAWGVLGAVLGPVGMLVVCYLPSRRKDGKETNPIRSGFRTLPGVSRKVFLILLILLVLVLGVLYFVTNIPKWEENKRYEQSVGTAIDERLVFTDTVEGTPSAVFTGQDSTYVVTSDNKLYTWGYNAVALNMAEQGAAMTDVCAVSQMGRDVYLLKTDKNLYRYNEKGETVKFADNVKKMVCTASFGAYLLETGEVFVWGNNVYGQMGFEENKVFDIPRPLYKDCTDIAIGTRHLLLLRSNGDVLSCGNNAAGALGVEDQDGFIGLSVIAENCKGIAAGGDFSLILTKDGILKSAGTHESGELGREVKDENNRLFGEVARDVESIGAAGKMGWYMAGGKLYTWGENYCGQLSHDNQDNAFKPQEVMKKVDAVSTSGEHLVVISEGKIYACGNNLYGQLGKLSVTHDELASVVSVEN